MNLSETKPSPRFAEVLRRVSCDHWEYTHRDAHQGYLRCLLNDVVVGYSTHDGGNVVNGPRNMAAKMEKACGCTIIGNRNRRRSRKAFRPSGFTLAGLSVETPASRSVTELTAEWTAIEATIQAAVDGGYVPENARGLVVRRIYIADRLGDLCQPVPPTAFPLEITTP